jgi:hypothetical protein
MEPVELSDALSKAQREGANSGIKNATQTNNDPATVANKLLFKKMMPNIAHASVCKTSSPTLLATATIPSALQSGFSMASASRNATAT